MAGIVQDTDDTEDRKEAIEVEERFNPGQKRDGHGRWTDGGGGGLSGGTEYVGRRRAAGDTPSPGGGSGGMPSTVATASVRLSGGGTLTMSRHQDGGTGFDGHGPYSPAQTKRLLDTLSLADDWDAGEAETIPGVGMVTKQRSGMRVDFDGGGTANVSSRDASRMEHEHEQLGQAVRMDTGNGPLDVYLDGKKVAFRHLGGDGNPVEVAFNRASAQKINRAVDAIIDDIDDPDLPGKAVHTKTVTTNVGKVRVELAGDWRNGTLTIAPVDGDDWGVTIDGPRHRDWADAMGGILDEAAKAPLALAEQVSLTEAAPGTPKGRRFRARLIKGDTQGSSGYYPARMLAENAHVFAAGLPMYIDHPSLTEQHDRPERSFKDLAGKLVTAARYEGDGLYADIEVYPHWADIVEAMWEDTGISIRASGTVEASTSPGIRGPIVTSLAAAESVDFVTAAGAGGKLVTLLESARRREEAQGEAEEEPVEAEEGKVPPQLAKFVKGKRDDDEPDDDDSDDDADDDEGEDDDLPPFLKKKIKAKESRNVGHWLESRIHRLLFSEMADDMFGEGRLTRDERIALSQAIGEGLTAFNTKIADQVPHLYERDLWDDPAPLKPAPIGEQAPVSPAPSEVAESENEPGSSPDNTDKEGEMPELTEAQARELEEARTAAENDKAAALAEAETARQATAAAELKLARFTALEAARPVATAVLAESSLPPAAQNKLLAALTADMVPLTDEHKLDEAALKAAVEESVKAEATYLASLEESAGAGRVRGLGESQTAQPAHGPAAITALEETYRSRGLSPEAAKLAALGRP